MAELYIIGQIVGAKDFPSPNLFCRWSTVAGALWDIIEGEGKGQTQIDHPMDGDIAKWAHPIDIHYITKGIQGWPKLHFQVWHHDSFGRNEIYGYGFCHVPTAPGNHKLECVTWRPVGTFAEQARAYFVGGGPQLKSPELVHSAMDRYRLRTQAMGSVMLDITIITKDFEKYGVEM